MPDRPLQHLTARVQLASVDLVPAKGEPWPAPAVVATATAAAVVDLTLGDTHTVDALRLHSVMLQLDAHDHEGDQQVVRLEGRDELLRLSALCLAAHAELERLDPVRDEQ